MKKYIYKERLKQVFELFDVKILDFEIDKIINMVKTDHWYKLEESKELDNLLNKSCKGMVILERKIIYLSSIFTNRR